MQVEDLDCHFNKCAVSSCKEEFFQPNDEGALDLITQGGYGDFMDYIEDPPVYFKLCHYHGHKLASKVNNPAILSHYGHAHSGREKGAWIGHIAWDNRSWLCYINTFFYYWYKKGFSDAIEEIKRKFNGHKQWSKIDINDHLRDDGEPKSKILWKKFWKYFFLNGWSHGGITITLWRKFYYWRRETFVKYAKECTLADHIINQDITIQELHEICHINNPHGEEE